MLFKSHNEWQNSDNHVKIRVVPYGPGWEDVYMTIGGQEMYFVISYITSNAINDLMEVLYYLHPDNNDHLCANHLGDRFDSVMEVFHEGTPFLAETNEEAFEKVGKRSFSSSDLVYRGTFEWWSEPYSDIFTIERDKSYSTDFNISISIEREVEDNKKYHFTVNYKEFCFALAKGITDALTEHGIRGYYDSVWSEINLKYFIFIKSVALDEVEKFKSFDKEKIEGKGPKSNLKEELSLIAKKM